MVAGSLVFRVNGFVDAIFVDGPTYPADFRRRTKRVAGSRPWTISFPVSLTLPWHLHGRVQLWTLDFCHEGEITKQLLSGTWPPLCQQLKIRRVAFACCWPSR